MSAPSTSQKPLLHFPDRPQFSGFMKPCRVEGEIQNLEVYGEIPADIDGTFYRVMPDPQFSPFIKDDPVLPSFLVQQAALQAIQILTVAVVV